MIHTLRQKDPKLVEAGRKGEEATAAKYGKEYYIRMGKTPWCPPITNCSIFSCGNKIPACRNYQIFIADLWHFLLFKAENRGEPPPDMYGHPPDMRRVEGIR